MELRDELEARYAATIRSELSLPGTRPFPEGFSPPRLPAALRESIVAAGELADPSALADFYCDRMPRMLVEQILRGEDPARRLLWMEIDPAHTPRLREALRGLRHFLVQEGLTTAQPEDPLEQPTCVARLAAATQLGSGLPLVGAYPAEREVIAADLAAGADAHNVLDLRLSGNLIHEICHGPPRTCHGPQAPWLVVEAAALHLGATAFPRHVFPDVPGEAIPGVAPFLLVGESLARLFGRAALWRVASGSSLDDMFGRAAGSALAAAGWQEWLRRREPPFARDAIDGVAWVKLADATRGASPLSQAIDRAATLDSLRAVRELPDLLRAAGASSWAELPWWREEPTEADAAMARSAVAAMFHVDVLEGSFQTHPHRPARFRLDLEACLLTRERDPRGVGPGEPPCWIVPPPLCRRLRERMVGPLVLEGSDHTEFLTCLLEKTTPWTSSRI
ncbi:MAG TPA: hypothetical protein VEP66_13665 [Myxococcales bacterium]|nr:hypothetical protein [Myxococcales bacterium]